MRRDAPAGIDATEVTLMQALRQDVSLERVLSLLFVREPTLLLPCYTCVSHTSYFVLHRALFSLGDSCPCTCSCVSVSRLWTCLGKRGSVPARAWVPCWTWESEFERQKSLTTVRHARSPAKHSLRQAAVQSRPPEPEPFLESRTPPRELRSRNTPDPPPPPVVRTFQSIFARRGKPHGIRI